MSTILIQNASVYLHGVKDVYIKDGTIDKIAPKISVNADRVLDARGKHVLPAFVDMHCHLREPGYEYKEDIASGSASAVKGGFGAIACMPNTRPVTDSIPVVHYIKERGKEVGLAHVLPIASITKGQDGKELTDMVRLSRAGAVAFSDDGLPVENANIMRLALEYAGGYGFLIISHSEDKHLSDGGWVNEGYHATVAGLRGITRASEETSVAREILIAQALNVPVHIAHISTRGSAEIIRHAKAQGVRVTCETCPHYFSATDAEILNYNTNAKINPPLRTDDDVAAIIDAIKDGTVDAIATDHAPHHLDDKRVEFGNAAFGTVGFESAYSLAVTKLVNQGHITIERLAELMSVNPSRILGQEAFGRVEEGAAANLTICDTTTKYVFTKESLASKSKNTLFDGWHMVGAVAATIVDGEIKYERVTV